MGRSVVNGKKTAAAKLEEGVKESREKATL